MRKKLMYAVTIVTVMCGFVECRCPWQGRIYDVGDMWHPGAFPCVNCTCQIGETGLAAVQCRNTACPKLTCDKPMIDAERCCPYCEVPTEGDINRSPERSGCVTPEGTYRDGDIYTSNSTGIQPTSADQCVLCICQDGKSLCHLKTCILPRSCTTLATTATDDCCPVCADVTEITWDDPDNSQNKAVIDAHLGESDCLDSGGIKRNGTSWHPTIASIGQIECITCSCLNGDIKCSKNCAPNQEPSCNHHKKSSGECCKTCPEHSKAEQPTAERKKKKHKGRKGHKGNKKRKDRKPCREKDSKGVSGKKRCKPRRGRHNRRQKVTTTTSRVVPSKPTPAPVGVDLNNLCIRRRSKYLVYKAISQSEFFIGFDDLAENIVEVYRWNIDTGPSGRSVVTYTQPELVPARDFRRKINNTNVVGTTGAKHYKRFKRRLKDKLQKCSDACDPELFIKILKRVKVRLLKFGDSCRS